MSRYRSLGFLLGVMVVALGVGNQTSVGQELIPRSVLFGNPERATPRLSPDGQWLAYRAPRDGVMNVYVAPVNNLSAARPVTNDRTTGISQYFWTYTNQHLVYLQDNNGDEDFHLYAVDLKSDEIRDLTPLEQIRAQVMGVSRHFPEHLLVGINDRDQRWFHDVYRIHIPTGTRELVYENNQFVGLLADEHYRLRVAMTFTPTGGALLMKAAGDDLDWEPLLEIDSADVMTTSPLGLDKTGEVMYLIDSRQRDTAALRSIHIPSGREETLFTTDVADVSNVLSHPTEHHIQAVAYNYERETWHVLDNSIQGDLDFLAAAHPGEVNVSSRTLDDRLWTVVYSVADGPVRFYLYDRDARNTTFLFSHRPELEALNLADMHPVIIPSRDGLRLVSYLSLPPWHDPDRTGRPDRPLPMVLLVHGGPWARDEWGFDPLHQLLANRGYAVLAVNYRGSTGFGKSFINAANLEWSGKMHDDLLDAVEWAVEQGIARRESVAIMGGSYGGYATLVGLTFTPDVFACGVDIVGPSNLVTLLDNPPPYWMPIMSLMQTRVGDYRTEEGREFLRSRSPLFRVDQIRKPLLIGQGAQDPRVKQAESDQIVQAMQERGIPVTYMLYPEEGHGFDRPENNISFFAVTEAFLARHLGGRYEEIGN
ncbi:MAG TPA: S9 family peptidase, partial [Pirellulaceae bacterium]|nr:S9 family peptidase [Pirellulaceae bacterium]